MPRWNIEVSVDSKGVVTGAQVAGRATEQMATKMRGAQTAVAGLQKTLQTLGVGLGLVALARQMVTTAASFQTLRVQLETVEGSATKAAKSFNLLKEFSARTPFQINTLTESWINLRAKGFEPTIRSMTALGNMAAAFGKDITQATQAVTQAAFGEAEMLKQFGIIMRQEGDKARITFRGVTKEIGRDAQTIVDTLLDLAETNFAGGMERQAETLAGKFSTLKDAAANLADAIMNRSGLLDALTDLLDVLTGLATLDFGKIVDGLSGLGDMLGANIGKNIGEAIVGDLPEQNEKAVQEFLDQWVKAGDNLATALQGGRIAQEVVEPINQQFAGLSDTVGETERGLMEVKKALELLDGILKSQEGQRAAKAAIQELTRAHRERLRLIREEADEARRLKDLLASMDEFLDELIGRGVPETLEVKIPDLGESAAEFADKFGDEIERSGTKAIAELSNEFAERVGVSVGQALADAILSGQVTNAIQGIARLMAAEVSKSISQSMGGGFGGGAVGAIGGAIVGWMAGQVIDMFGSSNPAVTNNQFLASVRIFSSGSEALLAASNRLHDAATEIADAAINMRQSLGRLETSLGANIMGSPGLSITQTASGEFKAVIEGIAGAFGESISEAARGALDAFAQNIGRLLRENSLGMGLGAGTLDVAGVAPEILAALEDIGSFFNFEEMVSSLETWQASLNSVATTLGAVTPSTDAAFQRLEAMRLEIERSGLSAEAAAPMLAQLAQAADILSERAEGGFFSGVAQVMQQMGMNAQQAALFQARADQISFKLTVAKLEIERRALGLTGAFWNNLFQQFNAFAANIHNFVVASARIVAPVIRAAPRVSRSIGSSMKSAIRAARESLREFLAGLAFESPGAPRPGKTGLRAALEEARRAASKGDVEAFKAASSAALAIAQELFGGTAGFDAIVEEIRRIGEFDPKVQTDPVVGAINKGFSGLNKVNTGGFKSLDTGLIRVKERVQDIPPAIRDPSPELTPPKIRDFEPLFDRLRERLRDKIADVESVMMESVATQEDIIRTLKGGIPTKPLNP